MSTEIHCSFCGVSPRDSKIIAGPRAHVCFDCVRLLGEIKQRDPDGPICDMTAAAPVDDAVRRVRELEAALRTAGRTIAAVLPPPHSIRCMWCDVALESEDAARAHVGGCEKHPAVIALAEARTKRGRRAR